jgi:hypothetical protein
MESNENTQKNAHKSQFKVYRFFNILAPNAQNVGPYTTMRPQFQIQVYKTEAGGCINVMINKSEVK